MQQWLNKREFDVDKDYILFINFMKQKFNVGFDEINMIWISTFDNDIIKMQTKQFAKFNKYVKSYNEFIVKKENIMPRLTKECERLYVQQSTELVEIKNKLADQKLENFELKKDYQDQIDALKLEIQKLKNNNK
ncbi:hypothetical protein [Spiroplasma culicicola]|uniref:Uncharacterized protein n=1 Tax=Spiroplasma culicicola AES-1 TaxID=1276246 RepID=W6A7E9_9MOLU|nr:hypothetical protein [Spiroplasma culicicola]AHI52912.1 hypothetical protein SCULI_v1c05710 [Spiroplasma culicicola AES-1]